MMDIITIKNKRLTTVDSKKLEDGLREGKVIIYPTDTIYGIGANAFSHEAVKKVFALKGRKKGDVFSVMVDGVDTIKKYAVVGRLEDEFLKKYLPGPVTVILPLKPEILAQKIFSSYTINERGAVGFRVIRQFAFIREAIKKTGLPLITTSANKSGAGIIESSLAYVKKQFKNDWKQIDLVIDAGDLANTHPSTVVDLSQTPYSILRRGIVDVNNEDLIK